MQRTSWTRRAGVRARLAATLACATLLLVVTPAGATPSLSSWSVTGSGLGAQTSVSCPSFGLCASVAGTTSVSVSTAPANGPWSTQSISGLPGSLQAVSCAPGTAFCVAVGSAGAVAVNTNTGSASWTVLPAQDSGRNLTSISCPSSSFCLAVDSTGGAIYSTNPSSSWSPFSPGHTLTAVSCASSSLCVGIDASHIYVSTNPSGGSFSQQSGDFNGNLSAIACAANSTCVAVDGSGYAWASGNASSSPSTWSATQIAGSLSAVACTPNAMCVATGGTNAYASDNPAAAGPSWATSGVGATPTAVACADQGLCAAVAGNGGAYVATLPAPSASTGSGSASSQTTATLNATVNPDDATLSGCYFEYGPTTSYGSTVPCASTPSPTGGSQSVSAQISGLSASTTYHFQVIASNAIGSGGGGDATFTTSAAVRPSPSIDGAPAVGNTLTCDLGVTLPAGASASFSWVRDTTAIAGATSSTYQVAPADATHHLYCSATISGDGGSASANSAYVAVPSETLGTVFETIVGSPSAATRAVATTITCSPQAVSACAVSLKLTTSRSHHTITIGAKSVRIAPAAKVLVTVPLNQTGRSLLAHNHKLKATLTVTGTVIGVIKGTLKRQTITLTTPHHARRRR